MTTNSHLINSPAYAEMRSFILRSDSLYLLSSHFNANFLFQTLYLLVFTGLIALTQVTPWRTLVVNIKEGTSNRPHVTWKQHSGIKVKRLAFIELHLTLSAYCDMCH